jgi:hypothetical protein
MSAGFVGFTSQVQDVSVREIISEPADFSASSISWISIFTVTMRWMMGYEHKTASKSVD